MSNGLYVPNAEGRFAFKQADEKETRPVLEFERDTGTLSLNFNTIFVEHRRKLKDVHLITHDGYIVGVVLTSDAMGPQEVAQLEAQLEAQPAKKGG